MTSTANISDMTPEEFTANLETILDNPETAKQFFAYTDELLPGDPTLELAREYFTNPEFVQALSDYSFNATYAPEDTMTTATNPQQVTSLEVLQRHDKPRKCIACQKKRKTSQVDVHYASGLETILQVCADCYDILARQIGRNPTKMEREIEDILRQQEEADHDAAYTAEHNAMDDVERFLSPSNPDCIPVTIDPDSWVCECGYVNPNWLTLDTPTVACLDCDRDRPVQPTADDAMIDLLKETTPMERVMQETIMDNLCDNLNALTITNAPERYGLVGEADAIYSPEVIELPANVTVTVACGPELGEELPKTFTDEIRKRVARQHIDGASVADLARAWGRTASSIKTIIKKFPNG